ncbi:MAG: hypothetical protein CL486_09635 [Acidobacteria bacterium]|nr:hypothetical protein [Acidobacteriota bacterium]|tara:strand:- start:1519 stop:2094 length:576 start_codon:yes stop_codon:yes gene_type:complete
MASPEASESQPIFDRIGIVGIRLIGGSVALAVRQRWPACLVIGVDDKGVLEVAQRMHAVDVSADDLAMLSDAQLIVLAGSIQDNFGVLKLLDEYVNETALITDVTSSPGIDVSLAAGIPHRFSYISGKLSVNEVNGGIVQARADLFSGREWFLTPGRVNSNEIVDKMSQFVSELGAIPKIVDSLTNKNKKV